MSDCCYGYGEIDSISLAAGGGGGSAIETLSGRTIWVDTAHPEATDVRAGLDDHSMDYPFKSITAAIAASGSGDTVVVRPGTYNQPTLIVPTNVTLTGAEGAPERVVIVPGGVGDVVRVSNGAQLRNVTVKGPLDSGSAAVAGTVGLVLIRDVVLNGGGLGAGLKALNGCQMLAVSVNHIGGTFDRSFVAEGTFLGLNDCFCISGTATQAALDVTNGECAAQTLATASGFTCSADGVSLGAGVTFRAGAGLAFQGPVVNALRVYGDNVDARINLLRSSVASGWDVLIDSGVTAVNFFYLTESQIRRDKISVPSAVQQQSTFFMSYASTQSGGEGLIVDGQFSVGDFRRGSPSSFGEGAPHTVGMKVLTNTLGESGNWGDVTDEAASKTASTFGMPGLGADNCLYIGGDSKFFDVTIDVVSAATLGAGAWRFEAWNGSTWETVRYMVIPEAPPYNSRAQTFGQHAEVQAIRFDPPSGWASKALNGETKYWIRLCITSLITSGPTMESVSLGTARMQAGVDGNPKFFGAAEPERNLRNLSLNVLIPVAGDEPTNVSVNYAAGLTVDVKTNGFTNSSRKAAADQFAVPVGLDTSKPLTASFRWAPSGADTGDVQWEFFWAATDSNTWDGSTPHNTVSVVETVSVAAANVPRTTEIQFTIPDAVPGDVVTFKLQRDARVSNLQDTLPGTVYIGSFGVRGTFWQ